MAWLMATAMATRPFWSEYRILAWEPTTCRGKNEKVPQPKEAGMSGPGNVVDSLGSSLITPVWMPWRTLRCVVILMAVGLDISLWAAHQIATAATVYPHDLWETRYPFIVHHS